MTMFSPTVTTPAQFYTWQNYACAYHYQASVTVAQNSLPLVLIHPIGVGLSGRFWQRFIQQWQVSNLAQPIYNPDLLGCGSSAMPPVAYYPIDWAEQLQSFLHTVVQRPVVLVVQGALFPVAIELVKLQPDLVRGLVLSGPPAWPLISRETPEWQHRLAWSIFDSPIGVGFYSYARRREFLRSFSVRQLFANSSDVDAEWLDTLEQGASDPASRHAVFSFLASFWRQDYRSAIAQITQPTLVVMGETASSISREVQTETPAQRLADYLAKFPQAEGVTISGRNVLPYESTPEFVRVVADFINRL